MKKIVRKTCRDGNLYPVVFNCLKNLPDSVLFHKAHGMRHPFSIYNISLERVLKAFNSVVEQLELINKVSDSEEDQSICPNKCLGIEKILKSQKELLESLLSHFDDCLNILKTLHPNKETDEKINDRFVGQWLKNAKHPTHQKFQDSIKKYKYSFAPIVNKIKHEHGQLRLINFVPINKSIISYYPDYPDSSICWSYPSQKIIGYYLEGVHSDGVIGTDLEIHSNNTAISLNRNLKYHFYHLYLVGIRLKNAIVEATKESFNIDISTSEKVTLIPQKTEKIEKVAEKISGLPQLFFPDEFSLPFPDVIYHPEDGKLILEYPSDNKVFWRGNYKLEGSFRLDDMKPVYRPPYWNLLYRFQ